MGRRWADVGKHAGTTGRRGWRGGQDMFGGSGNNDFYDLLAALLRYEPTVRVGAEAALTYKFFSPDEPPAKRRSGHADADADAAHTTTGSQSASGASAPDAKPAVTSATSRSGVVTRRRGSRR